MECWVLLLYNVHSWRSICYCMCMSTWAQHARHLSESQHKLTAKYHVQHKVHNRTFFFAKLNATRIESPVQQKIDWSVGWVKILAAGCDRWL